MIETTVRPARWTVEMEAMPQFGMAMERVYAWFENEIIDRAPVRFQAHNAFLTKGSPKTGVRVCTRTPVFGYSFNLRDLLNLD